MKQFLFFGFVVLVLEVLVYATSVTCAAPSTQDQSPTPAQAQSALLELINNKRIALAYTCGYNEGRFEMTTKVCVEYRRIATEHGNFDKIRP